MNVTEAPTAETISGKSSTRQSRPGSCQAGVDRPDRPWNEQHAAEQAGVDATEASTAETVSGPSSTRWLAGGLDQDDEQLHANPVLVGPICPAGLDRSHTVVRNPVLPKNAPALRAVSGKGRPGSRCRLRMPRPRMPPKILTDPGHPARLTVCWLRVFLREPHHTEPRAGRLRKSLSFIAAG